MVIPRDLKTAVHRNKKSNPPSTIELARLDEAHSNRATPSSSYCGEGYAYPGSRPLPVLATSVMRREVRADDLGPTRDHDVVPPNGPCPSSPMHGVSGPGL